MLSKPDFKASFNEDHKHSDWDKPQVRVTSRRKYTFHLADLSCYLQVNDANFISPNKPFSLDQLLIALKRYGEDKYDNKKWELLRDLRKFRYIMRNYYYNDIVFYTDILLADLCPEQQYCLNEKCHLLHYYNWRNIICRKIENIQADHKDKGHIIIKCNPSGPFLSACIELFGNCEWKGKTIRFGEIFQRSFIKNMQNRPARPLQEPEDIVDFIEKYCDNLVTITADSNCEYILEIIVKTETIKKNICRGSILGKQCPYLRMKPFGCKCDKYHISNKKLIFIK